MFNDSISDLLTRIRNANTARKRLVVMPYSKMKQQVADILVSNGFLENVKVTADGGFKSLELTLPVDQETITSLIRVSKPGRAGIHQRPRHPVSTWRTRYRYRFHFGWRDDRSSGAQAKPRRRTNL